jgi:hypothetical protein
MSPTLGILVLIGASVAEAADSASNGSVVAGHVHGAAGSGMSTMKIRINPPADVQSAVPAVTAACSKRQSTDVPAPARPTIPTSTIAAGLTEADVCGFIQHPDAHIQRLSDLGRVRRCDVLGVPAAPPSWRALAIGCASWAEGVGMSATRNKKPPRPVATLIREETPDNQLTMLAIQVDHTMHLVEAMAGVIMAFANTIRDEEEKNPELEKMSELVKAAFTRLDEIMRGER